MTFVMEQHIGHRAYYQNLRNYVDTKSEIHTTWALISYIDNQSVWNNLHLPQNLRGTLIGREQVRWAVKQNNADVLFFNTQVPAALLGKQLFQHPYVVSTDITPLQYDHMGEYYGHRSDRFLLLKKYKHHVNHKVFRKASYILPWSTWAANSLVKDYEVAPERIEVIPPGVDLELWKPAPKGVDTSPVRILFVGSDLERKGGLDLLTAYQNLSPGSAELILVTRSNVPKMPRVTVYNNLEPNSRELVDLYQSSDIFVLPTYGEAFGIAAVEASAAGLPVIATPVGGLTDIIIDGETGLLVHPGDQNALACAIQELANNWNKRTQFGRAARQRAERLFDARKNSHRIMEILVQVSENAHYKYS